MPRWRPGSTDVDLFARVDPDQKRRIIAALRRAVTSSASWATASMMRPAIHAAHVGMSVDGATEVARAAADMILLAPDLWCWRPACAKAGRTFANILKYVRMGTSSNFGNMLSMALASIVLPFLPLLPLQILLNNLLYDLSEIGIPFDEVDSEDIAARRPGTCAASFASPSSWARFRRCSMPSRSLVLLKVFRGGCGDCSRPAGSSNRSRRRSW